MPEFVTIKLPQSEIDKFSRWTDSLSRENKQKCQSLMVGTLLHIERLAKMFAPTDKGFLKGSIHNTIDSTKLGGSVYNGKNYAPYVEFGTGSKVIAPDDVKDYAMTFKGAGIREVNNRAQPYLFPAVRIGWNELIAKLKLMGFQ